jgi:hypothetical protein
MRVSDAPLTPEQIQETAQQVKRESYFRRALVGLDQFVNVLTGGNPDETISSRSERLAAKGNRFGKFMSWWLGKIQKQHGELAEVGDATRAQQVEQLEDNALGKGDSK